MWKKIVEWYKRITREEYQLIIWFVVEEITDATGGLKTISRSRKVFRLKRITKKTQTHIIGIDLKGNRFEIKTAKPFDYQISKIY